MRFEAIRLAVKGRVEYQSVTLAPSCIALEVLTRRAGRTRSAPFCAARWKGNGSGFSDVCEWRVYFILASRDPKTNNVFIRKATPFLFYLSHSNESTYYNSLAYPHWQWCVYSGELFHAVLYRESDRSVSTQGCEHVSCGSGSTLLSRYMTHGRTGFLQTLLQGRTLEFDTWRYTRFLPES